MELRKRPRPARVDPDFVSSPPALPPRKRAQKQAPAKKQRPRKRATCAGLGVGSPVTGLHPATCFRQARPPKPTRVVRPRRPFNWYAVCVRACYVLCDRGWQFKLIGSELSSAFLVLRLELVPVRSCVCLQRASVRTGLNFSNSVSATMNLRLHLGFEVLDSVLATRNLRLRLRFEVIHNLLLWDCALF
jgi:hypothetical protein